MNFPSGLCRRRSGMFTDVARLVSPDVLVDSGRHRHARACVSCCESRRLDEDSVRKPPGYGHSRSKSQSGNSGPRMPMLCLKHEFRPDREVPELRGFSQHEAAARSTLVSCLPSYLPAYLPTYLPTYIHTCIHTYIPQHVKARVSKSRSRGISRPRNAPRKLGSSEAAVPIYIYI